jgi:hypothetical protein
MYFLLDVAAHIGKIRAPSSVPPEPFAEGGLIKRKTDPLLRNQSERNRSWDTAHGNPLQNTEATGASATMALVCMEKLSWEKR